MKSKLLSPAGEINAGYAAIHYGANEVYLGLKRFSARALAHNFTPNELEIFTNYAKSKGVKVCLTLNTLIRQKDLPELIEILNIAKDAKVDALIVQDFGVVNIINQYFKDCFEIHASTQMAIHNVAGAKAAEKMGIKRIVLARELTFDEIENIVKNTTLETEVFIHGAMCYSYSGLCMFSALKNNASGNMGLCTYSCRESYCDKLSFSMKDLWVGEDVLKLQKIGVTALKIEGRRKNPLYVSAVTDYYRKILDGKDAHKEGDNLKVIFSRGNRPLESENVIDDAHSGHKGLLIGRVLNTKANSFSFKTNHDFGRYDGIKIECDGSLELFGFPVKNIKVSGKEVTNVKKGEIVEIIFKDNEMKNKKVKKDDYIYLASESQIKSAYPYFVPKEENFISRTPLDVKIDVSASQVKGFTLYSKAIINLDKSETTKNPNIVVENAKKSFAKTVQTDFVINDIKVENPKNIYVPVSEFNKLRNLLLDNIDYVKEESEPVELKPFSVETDETAPKKWFLKIDKDIKKYSGISHLFDEIIVDIHSDFKNADKNKIRIYLPPISRGGLIEEKAMEFYNQGYRKFMIDNIYGLNLLPKDADIMAYYNLYCLNEYAYFDNIPFTISPEDNGENVNALLKTFKDKVILPVIYNPPLFLSANKAFEEKEKDLGNYVYKSKDGINYVVEKKVTKRLERLEKEDAKNFLIDLTFADVDFKEIKDIVQK